MFMDITIDERRSVIIGYLAARGNRGFTNAIYGYETGRNSRAGSSNVLIGFRAGEELNGNNNMFIGTYAGSESENGRDNIFFGNDAGRVMQDGVGNVFVGSFAGKRLRDDEVGHNVIVGYSNCTSEGVRDMACNVGIGAYTTMDGVYNVSVGVSNSIKGRCITALGSGNAVDQGTGSVIIGHGIVNSGRNSLIALPGCRSHDDEEPYENAVDEHLNIHDVLVGNLLPSGEYEARLMSDILLLSSGSNEIRIDEHELVVTSGKDIKMVSPNIVFSDGDSNEFRILDRELFFSAKEDVQVVAPRIVLSDGGSNIFRITEDDISIVSDNVINITSPSTVFESEVTIDRLIAKDFTNEGQTVFTSNIVFQPPDGSSNWWTQYVDTSRHDEGVTELVFESRHGTRMAFTDEFYPEVLNFTGKHRCRIETPDAFYVKRGDSHPDQSRSIDRPIAALGHAGAPDAPDALNAQNDGVYEAEDLWLKEIAESHVGEIVVATGAYCDLEGRSDGVGIDEAIPVVKLADRAKDPRAFGVVGGVNKTGSFRVGNMVFDPSTFSNARNGRGNSPSPPSRPRVVVQSVGEGAIWVCDINGPIRNGDYITTSPIPGLGMRQRGSRLCNYTVAKATCDAPFDDDCSSVEFSFDKNKEPRRPSRDVARLARSDSKSARRRTDALPRKTKSRAAISVRLAMPWHGRKPLQRRVVARTDHSSAVVPIRVKKCFIGCVYCT